MGLAVPPRVRFLQKWKKAREAKKKERETLSQTMVDNINENLDKSSDAEVSDDEIIPNHLPPKDTYNFHNGNYIFNLKLKSSTMLSKLFLIYQMIIVRTKTANYSLSKEKIIISQKLMT